MVIIIVPSDYLGEAHQASVCSCDHLPNVFNMKGGGKDNDEALKAPLCAHSPVRLCAVDGSATKCDTSLWFIATEISSNTLSLSPWNKQHIRREIERVEHRDPYLRSPKTIYKGKCSTVNPGQGQIVALILKKTSTNLHLMYTAAFIKAAKFCFIWNQTYKHHIYRFLLFLARTH